MLERWRERDIFRESVRRRQGAEEFVFYEGPPTANGRPGSHHVLARVFKDIFPRYQTMLGKYVERKGGWDCHGLPVEIAVEQKLGLHLQGRHRALRHRRVQRPVPRVGVRVPRGLDGADRAHRLLGRPRAPLPHARPDLHRVGVVGAEVDVGQGPAVRGPQGRALLRALRHRALLARGRPGLPGRRGPERLREVPRHAARRRRCATATCCWCGRRRRGRWSRTPPSRSTRSSPTRAPTRATCSPRRSSRACWARRRRSSTASPAREMLGAAYEPPFPFIPAEAYGEKGHTRPARRLRHRRRRHRHRPHRDRVRRGRLPARPGAGARRRQPGAARRHLRRAHRPVRRPLGQGRRPRPRRGPARARAAAARGDLPARLPALLALRHAAALLRQAVLVHRDLEAARPPAGRQRDRRLAPGAHQARALRALAGEQRRLGDLARALLGHAAAGLALRERPRGVHGLVRRAGRALGRDARGPAPPLRRHAVVAVPGLRRADAPRARGDRRLVRLGLHAVRPAPRAVRERGRCSSSATPRTTSARRSTRRAAGSTR